MARSRRWFLQSGIIAAACAATPAFAAGERKVLLTGNGDGDQGQQEQSPATRPGPGLDTDWTHHTKHLGDLGRNTFVGAIGSVFSIISTDRAAWLRLISVSDLPEVTQVNPGSLAVSPKTASNPITTSGFLLNFTASAPAPLGQQTYLLSHAQLGQFALFIVPDIRDPQLYTAVINRLDSALSVPGPVDNGPGTFPGPITGPKVVPALGPRDSGNDVFSPGLMEAPASRRGGRFID